MTWEQQLQQCLDYCKDQVETSGGEILEGIHAADIDRLMERLIPKA